LLELKPEAEMDDGMKEAFAAVSLHPSMVLS
jgi:hypothetical protein